MDCKNTTNKFKLGVRQKVLLLLMSVLFIALTISGWLALQDEKTRLLDDFQQRGTDISRFVAKSLAYSVVGYDYHTISLLIDEITQAEDIAYAKVVNKKGNTMAESGELDTTGIKYQMMFEEEIDFEGDVIGILTLGLNTDTKFGQLETQKHSLIKREAFIILLIAIGEFLALSFVIIRPVSIISKSLSDQVNEDGQIIGEIPITSNDEFGELACRFNHLSANLNSANAELQSRVEYANDQLLKNNELLQRQSEELKTMNEEFKLLSVTDPLTGLYNRRYFEDLLETEVNMNLRHGNTYSLIMVDIDHFKKVNDVYGHAAGDIVIKEVSSLMNKMLRKTDVLCRIGGEEFVSLCKMADKKVTLALAEKLRKASEELKIKTGDTELSVTVSIGVVTLTSDNRETFADHDNPEAFADNFCRYADMALYASKETGRNKVTHYDELEA